MVFDKMTLYFFWFGYFIYFKTRILYILYLFYMYVSVHVTVYRGRKSALSFYHLGSRDQTHLVSEANALSEPTHQPKNGI